MKSDEREEDERKKYKRKKEQKIKREGEFWASATRSQAVKSLRTGNGFPLFGELIV